MNKFFIGLILGIAIAGGLAVYLNNTPLQFSEKDVADTSTAIGFGRASGPITLAPGTKIQEQLPGTVNNKAAASTPSYDFYDILQGKDAKVIGSSAENGAKVTKIYVQAGAFYNQESANDTKARITLLGLDARMKTGRDGDKIVNRVILGPLPDEDQAQQVVKTLSDEQIDAVIVRVNN